MALREVDGGPGYFAQFANSLPSDASYFPIGVWLESVPAGGRTKEWTKGGSNAVRSDTLIPSPHPSTKPGQFQQARCPHAHSESNNRRQPFEIDPKSPTRLHEERIK